jgi:hypothetical protein
MAQFIKSLLDFKFDKSYEPKFEQGRFSVINRALVTLASAYNRFQSNVTLSTDFQVTGVKYDVRQHESVTDYSGYNKKYIRDDGTYDQVPAFEEFARHPFGLKVTKEESFALMKGTIQSDSHEAYILNMLISWYKAKLYKDTGSSGGILRLKCSGFEDSHVTMPYYGELSTTHEIPMGAPNEEYEGDITINYRSMASYWSQPYVLRYSANSTDQANFYLSHLLGRAGSSALNVDIRIDSIDTSLLQLDPIGGERIGAFDWASVPWTKPETLWGWTVDYVQVNRLEHAFAACLELLGTMAAHPMPSFHESHMWQSMKMEINLARFQPTRARVRSNLEGEYYSRNTLASEFMLHEATHPKMFLMVSAVLNYYMWLGLPALVFNESQKYDDWATVFLSSAGNMAILATPEARAAVISMLVGKEVGTCSNQSAFMSFNLTPMARCTTVTGYETVDPLYPKSLPINYVHPYVSGSLVLGTVSSDLDLVANLHATAQFEVEDTRTLSQLDAWRLATVYRLFGQEVEVREEKHGTSFVPYANSKDLLPPLSSFMDHTNHRERHVIVDCRARMGRHEYLPSPAILHQFSKWTVTVTTPVLEAVSWKDKRKPLMATMTLPGRGKDVKFLVKSGTSYSQHIMRVPQSRVTHKLEQDFRQEHPDLAPLRPRVTEIATTALLDTEAVEDPVETAG